MRIRAAHDRAFVLENLHVSDLRAFKERGGFVGPGVDHAFGFVERELRQAQIVARREADHLADAGFGQSLEER